MIRQGSFNLYGVDLFGKPVEPKSRGLLSDRFVFPPFTVLDARQGAWQKRKRAWLSLGIDGEVGRIADGPNSWGKLSLRPCDAESTGKIAALGDKPTVFDPVLCELVYRWWSPSNCQIIDPFAGGSVRGIVAGLLGRRYWGCDLSQCQINANYDQIGIVDGYNRPVWVCGDSLREVSSAPMADFVFSCPPYGDLERYSDNVADLSAMSWIDFKLAYRDIISSCVKKLRQDRFACFVVGDFRDRAGFYRGFVGETIDCFARAGVRLYNEAVLVTAVGSASMRAKMFSSSCKLVKTHQNVLLFCKGDWKKAVCYLKESNNSSCFVAMPTWPDSVRSFP